MHCILLRDWWLAIRSNCEKKPQTIAIVVVWNSITTSTAHSEHDDIVEMYICPFAWQICNLGRMSLYTFQSRESTQLEKRHALWKGTHVAGLISIHVKPGLNPLFFHMLSFCSWYRRLICDPEIMVSETTSNQLEEKIGDCHQSR